MAAITASMVAELRGKTDAPMMECKKALTEAQGDIAKAEEILLAAGYSGRLIERVKQLIMKRLWPKDPEACVLEDALCLMFLETQFAETTTKVGPDKMHEIVQKTWRKMTPRAHALALELPLDASQRALVTAAVATLG